MKALLRPPVISSGSEKSCSVCCQGAARSIVNASQLSSGTVPTAAISGTYNVPISGNAATAITAANAPSLGGAAAGDLKARDIDYMAGCSPLATTDSQIDIYFDKSGPMNVVSVTCFSDVGAPVVTS